MQVRLFSSVIQPGADADFEREVNNWLNEQDDIEILSMTVSTSERDGQITMVFFIVYDELDPDDEGDELSVTLPRIEVEVSNPHLIPRMR